MPLDPLAKRVLSVMAAASPPGRSRPSPEARRQALARMLQFVRADVAAVTGIDGVMAGPAGDLAYRLYAPATDQDAASANATAWLRCDNAIT
jgi:acetyl esterase